MKQTTASSVAVPVELPAASQPEKIVNGTVQRRRELGLYALRRLAFLPPGLFVIATLSFFVAHVTPSNPGRAVLGTVAPQSAIERFNHRHGLDRSLWTQYTSYLDDVVHGRLGRSYYTNESVLHAIYSRLTASLELVVISLTVAFVFGLMVGLVGAYFRGRLGGRIASAFIGLGQAVPEFVIGLLLSYLLFFKLGWLPAPTGQLGFSITPPHHVTGAMLIDSLIAGQWDAAADAAEHMVLPVLTLVLGGAVSFARISKGSVGEALDGAQSEYARACGVPERVVIWQALRTVSAPILTYLAAIVAVSIGGVAIVERLFSWQGVGQWAADSMGNLDLPAIQGFVLVSGAFTFVVYIIADITIRIIDPRLSGGGR